MRYQELEMMKSESAVGAVRRKRVEKNDLFAFKGKPLNIPELDTIKEMSGKVSEFIRKGIPNSTITVTSTNDPHVDALLIKWIESVRRENIASMNGRVNEPKIIIVNSEGIE